MSKTAEEHVSVREGLSGIWRQVREYKQVLGLLSLTGLISAFANGVVPYVTGRFFDALISLSRGDITFVGSLPYWAVLLGVWALARIAADGIDWYGDRVERLLETRIQLGVQAEGFVHLLHLPLSFHADEHIEAVFSTFSNAAWRIMAIIGRIVQMGPQLLSVFIGIGLSYTINPTIASILVAGVFAYLLGLTVLLRGTAKTDSEAHAIWNDRWADAANAVSQITAVKQAAADEYEAARIRKTLRGDVVDLWFKNELNWNKATAWQRITVFGTQLAVFYVSVQYVGSGVITVGQLVTLNGYALMFFGPLVMLGGSWQIMRNGITSAGLIERIFRRAPEIYRPKNARSTGSGDGSVVFEDVSFRYGDGADDVLSHLSFRAGHGQKIALVGESGAGKSTIAALISAYYFPTDGRVLVDGVDTREWDLMALRRRIGVVPQEVALFNDTIRTNIKYGSFDAPNSAVERAAQQAHISDFIERLPKKYDTLVGERGIKLSVGQKQRVAIARAILRDPEFLILDEPTSALDIETEQIIGASLEKLMQGRTTFVIAHRLSTVRAADTILVVKDGAVAEQGSHKELLAKKGIYRHLHDLHVGLYE
jgi:ABC-type multidrug transport system fused ATPase/permease subunit